MSTDQPPLKLPLPMVNSKDMEVIEDTFVSVKPEAVPNGGDLAALAPIGESIDERFEISGELGRGGMGAVLVGLDRRLRRTVAVKIMNEPHAKNPALLRRFYVEAQVAAQLEHPNICPFYSLEKTGDGSPAFSMRLVPGRDFSHYIEECIEAEERGQARKGEHSLKTRLEHFLKVCDAMSFSHARGVLHRDLKPANVMLGTYNQVYVMDWGLARVQGHEEGELEEAPLDVTASDPTMRTRVGQVVGTPAYMPPEQASGQSPEIREAADQYSLGMILYELVTLRIPRVARSIEESLTKASMGQREPIVHRLGAPVPKGLRLIIEKATHPQQKERYQSVAELASDVRRYIRDEELLVMPDSAIKKLWRLLSKHPALTLTVILCLVIAGAASVVSSQKQSIEAQALAAKQTAHVTELLTDIRELNRESLARLRSIETSLNGLASSARDLLLHGTKNAEFEPLTPEDLATGKGPKDTKKSAQYAGQFVTFERSVFHVPNSVARETVLDSISRLAPIDAELRRIVRRPITEGVGKGARSNEGAMLQYAGFGLANGLLVAFPGSGPFGESLDVRTRTWYTDGLKAARPTWGVPYVSPGGEMSALPCTVSIRSGDDVLGVATANIDLALIADRLEEDKERFQGWRRTVYVNPKGGTLVDSARSVQQTAAAADGSRGLAPYDVPEVMARIQKGDKTGWLRTDDGLFVFDLLHEEAGWWLVVELDPKAYAL